MYSNHVEPGHLSPELRELVDGIIGGIITIASRANSNMDSNSIGGTNLLEPTLTVFT